MHTTERPTYTTAEQRPARRQGLRQQPPHLHSPSQAPELSGRKSKVIIISLVLSNGILNLRFLKITNGINILLGRAKHSIMSPCGRRFLTCSDRENRTGRRWSSAVLALWKFQSNYLSQTVSLGSGLKVGVVKHACGVFPNIDTCARLQVILRVCMRSSHIHNHISVCMKISTSNSEKHMRRRLWEVLIKVDDVEFPCIQYVHTATPLVQ
jgi:hypothetical protein